MISFKPYEQGNKEKLYEYALSQCENADTELLSELFEYIEEFSESDPAICVCDGCLCIRFFEGEYVFPSPVALLDGADEVAVVKKIKEYAIKEDIPLVLTDLSEALLYEITPLFRLTDTECIDEEEGIYTLRALTEISGLAEIPSVGSGDVSLTELRDSDEDHYKLLVEDEKNNEFWGYDYREDFPSEECGYVSMALSELEKGVSASFAVRYREKLCGEAILYAFDLTGGCECALRLLPEYQGRGIAANALELLIKTAKIIDVKRLSAHIDERNTRSINLFKKHFNFAERTEGIARFDLVL